MSEDFFSRWSRRKEAARKSGTKEPAVDGAPEAPGERAPVPGAAAPGSADREASLPEAVEPIPPGDELSADELAALPRIEDLTADSDISVFFRKGVPEALRNQALRRMWTLDPAIRDFVGHARDYAYDWNVPGGVPGSSPLLPGDDAQAMARRILGEPDPQEAQAADPEAASQARDAMPLGPAPEAPCAGPPSSPIREDDMAERQPSASHPSDAHAAAATGEIGTHGATAAPKSAPGPAMTDRAAMRRHGGATPV